MKFFEMIRVAIFVTLILAVVTVSATEIEMREATPEEPAATYTPWLETNQPLKAPPVDPNAVPIDPITESTIPEEPKPRYALTEEERTIVEAVVAAEAMGEDFDGQAMVAQCILNTAEATGMRPDEVVMVPGQYTEPDYNHTELVEEAVAAVFDDGYQATEEPVRFFYAPAWGTSKWHENNLEFVVEHGGHRFFKVR